MKLCLKIKKKSKGKMAMYVDLWQNTYLVCVRLWAPSLILETKKKCNKRKKRTVLQGKNRGSYITDYMV